jgi:hypothetical protein
MSFIAPLVRKQSRVWPCLLLGLSIVCVGQAQTMVSGDSAFIKIRLVRAKEIKGANVWVAGGLSGTPSVSTHNVLAYTYRYMTGNDLNGDASIGGSSGEGGPIEQEQNLVEGGPEPEEPPIGGGGGVGGGGTSSGGYYFSIPGIAGSGSYQGILQDSALTPNCYGYIPLKAGIGDFKDYLTGVTNPANPPTAAVIAGIRVKLQPGQEVTVCYYKPGSWKLPSGVGQVMVTQYDHFQGSPGIPAGTGLQQQEVYYNISRQDVSGDAAVDSRKGYGQPNREGQFPADPNAELRNVNFGDWVFKGGMFIGNVPSSSGDRSGTSRFQLFDPLAFSPQDQYTIPRMTVATVYQAGKTSAFSGAMTIGIFAPLTTTSESESDTTWATKWNIVPRASIPSNGTYEQNKDPWRKFTIADGDQPGLLSVSMTKVFDAPHVVNGNTIYKTTWSTPVFPGLCYALHDEQTLVDSNFSAWRYFADKEFEVVNSDLLPTSYRDLAPRYWRFFVTETFDYGNPYFHEFSLGWGGWW